MRTELKKPFEEVESLPPPPSLKEGTKGQEAINGQTIIEQTFLSTGNPKT